MRSAYVCPATSSSMRTSRCAGSPGPCAACSAQAQASVPTAHVNSVCAKDTTARCTPTSSCILSGSSVSKEIRTARIDCCSHASGASVGVVDVEVEQDAWVSDASEAGVAGSERRASKNRCSSDASSIESKSIDSGFSEPAKDTSAQRRARSSRLRGWSREAHAMPVTASPTHTTNIHASSSSA